jgi:hypothetical protein
MQHWIARTIRGFAILNVFFATLGLYFLAYTVCRIHARGPDPASPPYYLKAFYGMTIVNFLFLIGLLVASLFLWRLERRGRVACNIVFGGEIIYFLFCVLFSTFSFASGGRVRLFGRALGIAAGTGDMGINAQILTGYPLIALIILNIVYRKGESFRASYLNDGRTGKPHKGGS